MAHWHVLLSRFQNISTIHSVGDVLDEVLMWHCRLEVQI
jgi:hypothetical protein